MCERFVISPEGRFKQVFNIWIIVLSLLSTISAAYFACFGLPTSPHSLAADVTVESFFLMDICLNFFVQYKDEEDFQAVTDLRMIAMRYLRSYFIFDFLATVPLRYMKLTSDPEVH